MTYGFIKLFDVIALICVKSSIGLDNAGVPLNNIHRLELDARESATFVLAVLSLFKLWLSSLKKKKNFKILYWNKTKMKEILQVQ